MSVNIATMGMFRDCCGGAPGGGGAPPVYQYEARGEDFPINVDVIRVTVTEPDKPEVIISVVNVRSERVME